MLQNNSALYQITYVFIAGIITFNKPCLIVLKPYKNIERLISLADSATKDAEIVKGMFESHLSLYNLQAEIRTRESMIWDTVASELKEIEQLEHRIDAFETANEKYLSEPKKRYAKAYQLTSIPIGLALLLALSLFRPLISLTQWILGDKDIFHWAWNLESFVIGTAMILLIIGSSWLFISTLYRFLSFRNKRFLNRIPGDSNYHAYVTWKTRYNDLARLTNTNLQDKGVRELIRSMINERLTPVFALSLSNIEGKGLAEVIDVTQTIDSVAKHKLDFLISNMPGGSIGIAGPRGAGKSTLIQTYCGQNRSVRELKNKKVLGTMVSAPVKYDPREFILHLFSAVCLALLKEEDRLPGDLFKDELRENRIPPFQKPYRWILRYLPPLSLLAGTFLIISSFYLYSWHREFSVYKKVNTVIVKADSVTFKKVAKLARKNNTTITKPAGDTVRSLAVTDTVGLNKVPDTTNSFFNYYRYQVSKNAATPLTSLHWGLLLMTVGIFLLFFKRFEIARFDRSESRTWEIESFGPSPRPAESALRWLRKIKFQQSYTTGWSGSLKLPVALESGLSQAMTLAEKQLSNPEIITAFTDFLTECTTKYQVIIGIDELDKMASEEDAKLFLNEIKSIFGISRVFYLISVSENAMNSFERRGMPFRDVFDSSFDSIVYVDYLDLTATQLLLQRRIVGKPVPFFNLAYCLAGGLPRDVIRYFRHVLELAIDDRKLDKIVQRLVSGEVDAKIRALLQGLRQLRQVPGTNKVLDALYLAKRDNYTAVALETAAISLSKQLKVLTKNDSDVDDTPESGALAVLTNECRSYFAFITTLLSLFSLNDEMKIKALETNGDQPELGHIRQLLAIDHELAFERTLILRKKVGLRSLSASRLTT
ncbi:hypothetical protein INP83_04245 [Mucilaginibacter sp. 21P]|uniref:P-loop NTPase fold protein n=1 Tax=Mucilaginibacter sp. 21P TaxID=2778902 RepID=UPI001C566EBD|nr:P-loop NTPase fold protein [Mucilaginibacter sp. 21P]QXV66304.1 hypothetical protein INP83_04245 [Mucilaginibacter sp. 21P]